MTDQDQTSTGDDQIKDQTSKDTAGESGKDTDVDYKVKFTESQREAMRLKTELDDFKKKHPQETSPKETELPADEKKVREIIEKHNREQMEQAKKDDEQLKSDLDKLHSIHGDFDDKKLLSIVERYGVFNDNGDINWSKSMELYERLGGVADYTPKKKEEKGRTSDKEQEADKIQNVGKKSMHDIVQEGLKKFGIGG